MTLFEPVRCCSCGRFVSEERTRWHIEYGDYGTVYSAEVECEYCAGDYDVDSAYEASELLEEVNRRLVHNA